MPFNLEQISKIKKRKESNDIFYTPLQLTLDCIKLNKFEEGDLVLDATAGKKVFYDNYPDFVKKDWCEITDNKDFFEYNKKVDWVYTNPPFSLLNKILDKCCKICNKGFGLIMTTTALTIPRINRMKQHHFYITEIMIFQVLEWFGFTLCFVIFEKNKKEIFKIEPKDYKLVKEK